MKRVISAVAVASTVFAASNAIAEDITSYSMVLAPEFGAVQTIINPIRIADYSYRNLEGNYFESLSLAGYDFTNSNLRGAHFINVTEIGEANFTGADLSGALWVDGRVCAEGSIGVCK